MKQSSVWKRSLVVLLSLILLLSFAPIAQAAEITVNDAVVGQTYSAYRIFDVTKTSTEPIGYAYSIRADSAWYADVETYAAKTDSGLTLTATTNPEIVNVSVDESVFDAASFAAYLNENKAGKTADGSAAATSETVSVAVDAAGYYFVDSSLGALCILHTAADTVVVNEKNQKPDVEKTVRESTASIGDTVHFTITVTAGGAADTEYIVHDSMEAGLTLDTESFVLTCEDAPVPAEAYTITAPAADGHSFDIAFADAYTATLAKDSVITITYSALLNENAEIADETNDNAVTLTYGNSSSVEQRTETKSFSFDLVKTTVDDVILDGASFRLYDAAEGGNEIALVLVSEGVYRPALDEEEGVDILAGKATVQGLASGTYYLEEIEAPEGYNQLSARVEVVIGEQNLIATFADDGSYQSGGVQVENLTGSQLPSTGGIGTTVFYVVGGTIMTAAAAAYLIRRRMLKQHS